MYLAQVAALSADGQPIGSTTTGLVVSYSPEYGETRDNPQLLRELASDQWRPDRPAGGGIFDAPAQAVGSVSEIGLPLLWLALLLLPLDIGLRRLHLRLSEYFPSLAALRSRSRTGATPAGPDEAMTRLSAAKRRAQVPSHDIRAVPGSARRRAHGGATYACRHTARQTSPSHAYDRAHRSPSRRRSAGAAAGGQAARSEEARRMDLIRMSNQPTLR